MTSVHARRHATVKVELADEKTGDEAGGIRRSDASNVEFLAGFGRNEGAIPAAFVLERLDHGFALALDVELAIGDAAPDGPEDGDSVEEEGLIRCVGRIVDKHQRPHFATRAVRGKGRITTDLELERLSKRIHHDLTSLRRPLRPL